MQQVIIQNPVPVPVSDSWNPTSLSLSENAKLTLRKSGIIQLIFAVLGIVFAAVISALTGSVTNANGQLFIIAYNIFLFVLSFVALTTSCGCCGKGTANDGSGVNPGQSSDGKANEPIREGEVEWNIIYWKREGLERFFAWIGLSLHSYSDLCGYCAVMHSMLSFMMELCATIYGGYASNIQNDSITTQTAYYAGRTIPIVCLVLTIVQLILMCVQIGLAGSFKPNKSTNFGVDFGDNLMLRASALGCLLSFEALIVSLYCFSPNDTVPAGPWTNFSSYMGNTENWTVNPSTGEYEPPVQPTKIFFVIGAVFGALLETTIVGVIILCSLCVFKGNVLRYLLKGIFFTQTIIVLLIFVAALIVEIVYLILSLAFEGGFLNNAIVNLDLSGYTGAACEGDLATYCHEMVYQAYLRVFFYIFNYSTPLVCAAYCIQQFYKLVKAGWSAVDSYVDSFAPIRPAGQTPAIDPTAAVAASSAGAGGNTTVVVMPQAQAQAPGAYGYGQSGYGYPPSAAPQGAYPPSAATYGAYPPSAAPQGAYPPSAAPQGSYPPSAAYPGAYPGYYQGQGAPVAGPAQGQGQG